MVPTINFQARRTKLVFELLDDGCTQRGFSSRDVANDKVCFMEFVCETGSGSVKGMQQAWKVKGVSECNEINENTGIEGDTGQSQ